MERRTQSVITKLLAGKVNGLTAVKKFVQNRKQRRLNKMVHDQIRWIESAHDELNKFSRAASLDLGKPVRQIQL